MKRFHYDDHNQLRRQLADLIDAYNFGRRLKTLRGLTPYALRVHRQMLEIRTGKIHTRSNPIKCRD